MVILSVLLTLFHKPLFWKRGSEFITFSSYALVGSPAFAMRQYSCWTKYVMQCHVGKKTIRLSLYRCTLFMLCIDPQLSVNIIAFTLSLSMYLANGIFMLAVCFTMQQFLMEYRRFLENHFLRNTMCHNRVAQLRAFQFLWVACIIFSFTLLLFHALISSKFISSELIWIGAIAYGYFKLVQDAALLVDFLGQFEERLYFFLSESIW